MASKRKNKPALAALSVPVAVALILNTFVQPVQATFGSGRLTPCPDSVLAIGNEKIGDLLAHLDDAGEGSSFSGGMQDGTEGEANEGQETADQGPVATDKNPKRSADNERSAEDTVGRGTESDGPESNSSNGQEQTGLWGTMAEYWRQLRALRLEMPELSLTEAREAWEQILSLLNEMPELSIGEAKKVWREIRAMRLEMSGLGFEEAKEIWEQIRELQAELPKLSFEEAKEIWKQISKLQVEFPDLGLAGTKEIWEQIRELQAELPDLSFEEARKAMGQIGDMRVEMPDLSFEEVQAVWLQQIRILQSEMPDPNFGKAWELWQKIRGLQVDFPDLSFNDAREAWKHIQAMQIEFPNVDVGNAQDFLSQLRAVQIGVPEVSDDEARALWVQIQRLSENVSPPDFPELERVLQQIKELRLEVPSLGFDEARELWFELQELRGALPELSFEQAKDLWLELRDLKDELPAADGIFDLVVHRAERFLRGLGFEDTDGDGHLNWPEGTPFEGQDVNLEVIVTDGAGIAIAFVPVGGDIVDGVAFLIGKDPYTGECLTQLEQVLVAIAIIPLVPLSVRSARVAAKQVDNYLPLVKRGLVDFLPDSPASVRLRLVSGLVHPRFKEFRTMAGEGATTAQELADSMNISKFTSTNYRESLRRFTGISEEAASGLEAHHILPREFEEQFLRHGIETVHDPRLMVWVNPDEHRAWSSAYSSAWADFFERTPDATRLQVLEEARELSEEYGYKVLFELAE